MAQQAYDFAIDSFTINNTRSRHLDTDFVAASVAVGNTSITASKGMGDLNNGTFNVGIKLWTFVVDDSQTAVFSYTVVNNGHSDPTAVEKALESAVNTLATKGAQLAATAIGAALGSALGAAIGTAAVPLLGTALGALAGWFVGTAGGLIFADCDGSVAAGVHAFTGAQLRAGTSQGLVLQDMDHAPGTDSPSGCGSNSDYDVSWSIHLHICVFAGPILDKYNALGGAGGLLGNPLTDDTICPDGHGHFVHFENGSIYWTPETGAWSIHGAILGKWGSLGWERCPFLGYPVTDETGCPDGVGRFNGFQQGSIYWTPTTGAWSIHGAILAKWGSLGWERCSFLGYPVTDETGCPDGVGRFNGFQQGSIYWTPTTGAWSIHGAILAKWGSLGWERSALGYPISDEQDRPAGGRMSLFQHGQISWTPQQGAWIEV